MLPAKKMYDENNDIINQLSDELANSFFQTIKLLSNITNLTERFYEGSHSRFTAEKCRLVAEALGMQDEDVFELQIAAELHDLGKVAFIDSSLYKYANEMTGTEFDLYSKHPEIGKQILLAHNGFSTIAEIVAQHHEKLDGTGFPNHLTEENILPGAKILIVVDYFHNALYKKQRNRANSPTSSVKYASTAAFLEGSKAKYAATMNYLYKKAGILFEKKVVEVFTDIMESERDSLGHRAILRIPVNKIESGMVFAEDYYTRFGMLIAAKGETCTKVMVSALVRFAENGEIPHKILIIR